MIPKHKQFIEAIKEKKKISLQFYSTADSGVIDLICAPTDYGPGAGAQDGVNRYWFWDYTSNIGSPILGLLPKQVLDIRVLGEMFDPADLRALPPTRSIPGDESPPSGLGTETPSTAPARSEGQPSSSEASSLVKN